MSISIKDRYPGQVDTSDLVSYPEGACQNVISSGDGRGTPWEKDLANDLVGFHQAALAADFATPSGTPEKVGASQVLDAIRRDVKRDLAVRNWERRKVDAANFQGSSDYFRAIAVAQDFDLGGNDIDTIVVAGDDGRVYYSYNSFDFFQLSPAGGYSDDWNAVAWLPGPQLWALAGDNGELQTSPDLVTWTVRTAQGSPSGNFEALIWCEDLSLALLVGDDGGIWTSTNGTTWTARTAAGGYSGDFKCATWSPELSLFVIGGSNAELQTSPDGVTWTSRSGTFESWVRAATWSPELGLFAAVSDDGIAGRIHTSTDGITWTQRLSTTNGASDAVHWSSNLKRFIADANQNSNEHRGFYISSDGINWELQTRVMSTVYGFAEGRHHPIACGRLGLVYVPLAV